MPKKRNTTEGVSHIDLYSEQRLSMQIRALRHESFHWQRTLDVVPYSVSLELGTPSQGVHISAIAIRKEINVSEDPFVRAFAEQPLGITLLSKGREPCEALIWHRADCPKHLTDEPSCFLAHISHVNMQILFDLAVDLTPANRLQMETALAKQVADEVSKQDEDGAKHLMKQERELYQKLTRLKPHEREAFEVEARLQYLEAIQKQEVLHARAERAICVWHLLEHARTRRETPAAERKRETERFKKLRTTHSPS